ncbi:MAG: hypothetical protein GY857_08450 [Desulfobacula sp.]|nr:hypothetical protein [Desulfobacula sp.]
MKIKMFKNSFAIYTLFAVLILFHSSVIGNTLPDAIISLPENENAILVEKQSQKLYVYSSENKKLNLAFSASCSTGETFGAKKKQATKKPLKVCTF